MALDTASLAPSTAAAFLASSPEAGEGEEAGAAGDEAGAAGDEAGTAGDEAGAAGDEAGAAGVEVDGDGEGEGEAEAAPPLPPAGPCSFLAPGVRFFFFFFFSSSLELRLLLGLRAPPELGAAGGAVT